MKKITFVFIVTLILGLSSTSFAQRPSITVGLKTWIATWDQKVLGESVKSDYGLMYGPNINLRYDNFFGGLSYLLGGGFSFPTETYYDFDVDDYYDEELEADRSDMDLSVGYYFHPNIAIFLGYKSVDIDIKYSDTFDVATAFNDSGTSNVKMTGPAFGISGYYPIGQSRWVLFGNFSFVSLDGEAEGDSIGDFTGPAIEFGGAYAVENIPLSVSVGYKYQSYKSTFESVTFEDNFSGLTLGVNYTF